MSIFQPKAVIFSVEEKRAITCIKRTKKTTPVLMNELRVIVQQAGGDPGNNLHLQKLVVGIYAKAGRTGAVEDAKISLMMKLLDEDTTVSRLKALQESIRIIRNANLNF